MSDKNKRVFSASAKPAFSTPTRPKQVRQNSVLNGEVNVCMSPRSAATPSSTPAQLTSSHHQHHAQTAKSRLHSQSSSSIPIPSPSSGTGSASRIPRTINAKRAEQFKTLSQPLIFPKQNACHKCGTDFSDPNDRISLTDVASKVLYHFHRNHINCCKCDVKIDPSQPKLCKDGAVYCQNHWPHNRVCYECHEPIIGGSLKAANEQYYHREHLRCFECKVSLYEENGEKEYYPYKDRMYCQVHRQQVEVDCGACKQKGPWHSMVPSKSDESMYHPECIKCWVCSATDSSTMLVQGGRMYCTRDFDALVNHRCSECGECIRVQAGQSLIAANNKGADEFYHSQCVKCDICQTVLKDYLSKNGQLRCEKHAGLPAHAAMCECCHQEIDEACLVKSMGRKWHRKCYNCSFCADPVEEKTCTLKDDKLACQRCYTDQTPTLTKQIADLVMSSQNIPIAQTSFKVDPTSSSHVHDNASRSVQPLADVTDQANNKGAPARPPRPVSSGNQALTSPSKWNTTSNALTSPSRSNIPSIHPTRQLPVNATAQPPPIAPKPRISIPSSVPSSAVPSPRSSSRSPPSISLSINEYGHSHSASADMTITPLATPSPTLSPSSTKRTDTIPTVERQPVANSSEASTLQSVTPTTSEETTEQLDIVEVGKVIGKGGCATVRLATDSKGRQIAVKIMKSADLENGVENEIALMRSLRHPHIVSFLGTRKLKEKDELHIYMEYINGCSLHEHIKKSGKLDEKLIKLYLKQLLQALAYCHKRGVIHRDIKGKNVLLDASGAKLCDFGSAKKFALDETSANPTMNYGFTALWLAPEYVGGKYNNKADIWSLGCVVIEMASGKDPWDEKKFKNPFTAIYHIGAKKDIPAIPSTLSIEGQNLVRRMLALEANERPSAEELLKSPYFDGLENNGPPVTPSRPAVNVMSQSQSSAVRSVAPASHVQSPAVRATAPSLPVSSPNASPISHLSAGQLRPLEKLSHHYSLMVNKHNASASEPSLSIAANNESSNLSTVGLHPHHIAANPGAHHARILSSHALPPPNLYVSNHNRKPSNQQQTYSSSISSVRAFLTH